MRDQMRSRKIPGLSLAVVPSVRKLKGGAPQVVATAEALRDGWLHTGDLGYVDDDGFLYLVDRKKDMIDSGGVKVYPKDIEEIAARHPAVREVAVFGIPHDDWGEEVIAVVEPAPGVDASAAVADELLAHCETMLARY